jgi:c-opsin
MAAWTPYSILALFETFIGDAGQSSSQQRNISSFVTSDQSPEDEEDNFFYYVGTISPAFATIPSLFAKTSAVLNPLIYGLLNTQVTFRSYTIVIHFS